MKTASVFALIGYFFLMVFSATPALAADPSSAAVVLQGLAPAAAAKFIEVAATVDTLRQLRTGGYTLYLRHGNTDNTVPDRVPAVDLNDCSTQRPMTEAGRQLMVKVGDAIRKTRIPIGEFKVSPLCRARESAAAAFPKLSPEVDMNLMYVANFTDGDKAPIIANTRRLLSTTVPSGSNRLILAHAPNLMELIGYFPKEGTLVIFRPRGEKEGFDYIASISPALWGNLWHQDHK